jgi:arginase
MSLLGIAHSDNSSFLKGAAAAPPLIRREVVSDCYGGWSEAGIDLGAIGRLINHGHIKVDDATGP